jgi:hypothetical protein
MWRATKWWDYNHTTDRQDWNGHSFAGILKSAGAGVAMTTVHAHFDGKVIVPDEPLDLPPNQALIVQIESLEVRQKSLRWLGSLRTR